MPPIACRGSAPVMTLSSPAAVMALIQLRRSMFATSCSSVGSARESTAELARPCGESLGRLLRERPRAPFRFSIDRVGDRLAAGTRIRIAAEIAGAQRLFAQHALDGMNDGAGGFLLPQML